MQPAWREKCAESLEQAPKRSILGRGRGYFKTCSGFINQLQSTRWMNILGFREVLFYRMKAEREALQMDLSIWSVVGFFSVLFFFPYFCFGSSGGWIYH